MTYEEIKALIDEYIYENTDRAITATGLNEILTDMAIHVEDVDIQATATTGEPGTEVVIVNNGTARNPRWVFTIPRGNAGATGAQGPAGQDGQDGQDGAPGKDGKDGTDGAPGTPGKDGKDGEKGDPFTYDDFTPEQLAGLTGPQGPQGPAGQNGTNGTNGKSAYAYAQDGGYTGTEQQFAAKLAQEIPAISTNIATDASSDTKTASPKAVKTYVDNIVGNIETLLAAI